MTVAVDARRLQEVPLDGVGRVLVNVLPLLAPTVPLVLLTDARRPPPAVVPAGVPVVALRGPLSQRSVAWLQVAAPRWLVARRPPVFHCPFHGLPYRQPVPMVVSIHDLLFERKPAWFAPDRRAALRAQGRWAARTARRILVPSLHVRDDVLDAYGHLGVTSERVLVAPNAVDPAFSAGGPPAAGAPPPPYVVTHGGARRRRLAVAVEAWHRSGGGTTLVVVGPEAPPPAAGIRWVGPVPDVELAALLRGASAFLTATGDEGFGLPSLEAAACGVPVVCARVGALPEVLGDAPAWAADTTAEALGDALGRVLADTAFAAARRDAGLRRVAEAPGWEAGASVTARAYREALW